MALVVTECVALVCDGIPTSTEVAEFLASDCSRVAESSALFLRAGIQLGQIGLNWLSQQINPVLLFQGEPKPEENICAQQQFQRSILLYLEDGVNCTLPVGQVAHDLTNNG